MVVGTDETCRGIMIPFKCSVMQPNFGIITWYIIHRQLVSVPNQLPCPFVLYAIDYH